MNCVLIRRVRFGHGDRGKKSCDREGRDWSDASKTRMGRIHWKLKRKAVFGPRAYGRSTVL